MPSIDDILGCSGRVAARLKNYEPRPQQMAMALAVEEAIQAGRHLIVEAGTGVGKSFAYLVPAILAVTGQIKLPDPPNIEEPFSKPPPSKPRVVIATHTISLQEQLLRKDLPFLNSVIPLEFSAVLVKGRRNYLSQRRLTNATGRARNLLSAETEFDQLRQITDWSKETSDGSLSDLQYRPMPQVWDEVASDHGNCMGRKCPTYGDCFYYRARRRIHNAQILIVNHAMFFSDLALRRDGAQVLPNYDVVIFDEAHNVEAVAGNHLGLSVSSGQVEWVLNKLYNDRTNRGLLVHHNMGDRQQKVMECRFRAEDLFDAVGQWYQNSSNGRVHEPNAFENALSDPLNQLAGQLRNCGKSFPPEQQQDFIAAGNRLETLASQIETWRSHKIEEAVFWVEESTRRGRRRYTLAAAPIDVEPELRKQLFDKVPTVVMTSATLATGGGSFDFFKSRVGLAQSESLCLGSPFDYARQTRLILLDGMPDPGAEPRLYEQRAAEMIRRYTGRTEGRAFVLFTSYQMMKRVASMLARWLAEENLTLFSQADGMPRSLMLSRFKENARSVLFGTDSFWQGVDVQGEALQNVIITKLPFGVPDRPLIQARLQRIRARGGNPFRDYQLPEAVIKFKQGFGRLIRSKTDKGIVVILDPRVRSKPYGRTFLASLPDCHRVVESV